jgi:hypothetical protein
MRLVASLLKQIVATLAVLHAPVSPRFWWQLAQVFAAGEGWQPTMNLIAILGIMAGINELLGGQGNLWWVDALNLIGCTTWAIIAVLSIFIIGRRSAATMHRIGLWGATRPRWWFELARMLSSLTTIAGLSTTVLLVIAFRLRPSTIWLAISFAVVLISLASFFVSASIGYAISFERSLPRTGRAYECVHFFYCVSGPLTMCAIAAGTWSVGGGLGSKVLSLGLCVIAILWMAIGLLTLADRSKAKARRNTERLARKLRSSRMAAMDG